VGLLHLTRSSFPQISIQSRKSHETIETLSGASCADRRACAPAHLGANAASAFFNTIVSKDFFEKNKLTVKRCKFFLVEGNLQSEDNVVHVQAKRITQLSNSGLALASHDFH
jgi:hypothetical protein